MRFGAVNFETRGKVALLTLDEPQKLNALSPGIRQGILEGLKQADADDNIRVAVITGNGDKLFAPAPTSASSTSIRKRHAVS